MRVIMTHEQADFDALASMLGASLIDESALAVLPRRMNRNVRAFFTIYGAELPFVEQQDLPGEPVESIWLVDTQSMISLKGTGPDTKVYVVDHHAYRADLPAAWQVKTVDIGATTTLFVEDLIARNGHLSVIHATLLLLGIYEDTGSLTFSRTTGRDLRAAAYLVEQGASLPIAADYLNHPLSQSQQTLYDELRRVAETLEIHGHSIIVSRGSALEMEEEVSTIAHKLRDLLDPDALLLLVRTRGGVQLIARSTTDSIDVSEIAAYFGGGGHVRAAAGLVRGRELEDVYEEMKRILPKFVHPAITVAEIMSRGPQVLAPETSVGDAARRMQRYGYEGYPVVKDGKVVGLLTRRAVDRAIGHKLNMSASSLMDAGEVTVYPHDSIEQLQQLMTDTGWGQVPVVDPQDGSIVGIVTRTDLLKRLTHQMGAPGKTNLADKLRNALPAPHLALIQAVAGVAAQQRIPLFIVGGFVRDLLLDRPSMDFDFVVEGEAISLAHALVEAYGGRVTTHARFGTAKWYIDEREHLTEKLQGKLAGARDEDPFEQVPLPKFLDLISARTEFYTYPTALPVVESGSIKLDLHRRDFTINTLALRLDGRHYGDLHDYWGGLSDLRHGLVRVLHSLSFVDDPTRMLRAVRFEQRFNFEIEARTLELLQEAISLLDRISGDRVRHELDHILDEEKAVLMLARLDALGLLNEIHANLTWDGWFKTHLESLLMIDQLPDWASTALAIGSHKQWEKQRRQLAYMLWLLRLPQPAVKNIARRLMLSRSLVDEILAACQLYHELPALANLHPSQLVSQLEQMPIPGMFAAYLAADESPARELLERYLREWRSVTATIRGDALRKRGLPPGPGYRRILESLRAAWLDGKVNTIEEEADLLERLIINEYPGSNPTGDAR